MSAALSRFVLDYQDAATTTLLENLSGIAVDGDILWTVSDEGRSFECLRAAGGGFALQKQYLVDDLVPNLPGAPGPDDPKGSELDLESVDFRHGALWLCGSHCNVRKKPKRENEVNPEIRVRPSRNFLARLSLGPDGISFADVVVAPIDGPGSIRDALANDPYLRPFINLPSKENGLDIEGLAIGGDHISLGLRGPTLDGFAVIAHVELDAALTVRSHYLSFLDLGGLAIRDLCRSDDQLIVIAGPVNDADGPFALYEWTEMTSAEVQRPKRIYAWQNDPAGNAPAEKPEGICALVRDNQPGYAFVYDRPHDDRIQGSRYFADWIPLGALSVDGGHQ